MEDLHLKARNYTLRYFTEVAYRNIDILDMSAEDFYSIISDDELNTREEDHVWKLCVKWIDRNPESRKRHVAHLMTGVRLGLMTPKVGTHIFYLKFRTYLLHYLLSLWSLVKLKMRTSNTTGRPLQL